MPGGVGDGLDDRALGVGVELLGAQQDGVAAHDLRAGHLGAGVLGRLADLDQLLARCPGSRKLLPPAKSMPKLKPRKTIDAMQSSTTTAVIL